MERELADGNGTLGDSPLPPFSPDDEMRYRAELLEEERTPTLWCVAIVFIIWAAFAWFDTLRLGWPTWQSPPLIWLFYGCRWVVLAALGGAFWAILAGYARYDRITLPVYVALGVAAGLTAIIGQTIQVFAVDTAMIVIVMAAFLPIGLTFFQALAGAVIVTLSALASTLLLQPPELWRGSGKLLLTVLVALVLASLGGYLREKLHRTQFQLRKLLSRQAVIDHLTGLPNRRYFEMHIADLLHQCAQEGAPSILAMVDVDHFKLFNDRYGHRAGDVALRRVASAIQSRLRRPQDFVARIGGEEFCIFLFGLKVSSSQRVLDEVMAAVRQLSIRHQDVEAGIVTVSIGAAAFDGSESWDALYRRADQALYRAKADGRNAVCVVTKPEAGAAAPDDVARPRGRRPSRASLGRLSAPD
ncbi:MAG: diguanylate cyclase [Pigmentiphaga sp.]